MVKFVQKDTRTDVYFDEGETAFDIAAIILAICAYPTTQDQKPGGPANMFWDALYFCIVAKDGKTQRTAGLPSRIPSERSALTQLRKGFDRIDLFRDLMTGIIFSFASGGGLSINPSRDFRRMDIRLRFDGNQTLIDSGHVRPKSITAFLQHHQPAFGRGVDEDGTKENETAKTLNKRHLRPMARITHILSALSHEINSCADTGEDWGHRFIHGNPNWALRVAERSTKTAAIEAQMLRQFGMKSASVDRMIHLHLPEKFQILPPQGDELEN